MSSMDLYKDEDYDIMQYNVDNLVKWSYRWQIGLNEAKCKSLHLVSSNQRLEYTMNTEVLGDTRNEKDLGVLIESQPS